MESTQKRGRGRPAGSKNKVKTAQPTSVTMAEKRGRGRPKGSLNKKTLTAQKPVQPVTPKEQDKPIHVYRSKKCSCVIRSPINFIEVYCGDHRNELTRGK